MTIKDSMHAANQEVTSPFAVSLGESTAREIDAHTVEEWDVAMTHAAVMVRNGWTIDEASYSASHKFNVPYRPLLVVLYSEMATFGQASSSIT